jgi:hypothetical protein
MVAFWRAPRPWQFATSRVIAFLAIEHRPRYLAPLAVQVPYLLA